MFEGIELEAKAWEWLEGKRDLLPGYKSLFEINGKLSRERQKASPSEDKIESFINDFSLLVESNEIIQSKSTTGRFINSIEDKEVAFYALKTFIGDVDKEMEGALSAILFKKRA